MLGRKGTQMQTQRQAEQQNVQNSNQNNMWTHAANAGKHNRKTGQRRRHWDETGLMWGNRHTVKESGTDTHTLQKTSKRQVTLRGLSIKDRKKHGQDVETKTWHAGKPTNIKQDGTKPTMTSAKKMSRHWGGFAQFPPKSSFLRDFSLSQACVSGYKMHLNI